MQFLGDGTQAEVAESYVTRFEPNSVRFDSLVQAGLTAMQHNKDCALFKKVESVYLQNWSELTFTQISPGLRTCTADS